jgi:hypothetical protein
MVHGIFSLSLGKLSEKGILRFLEGWMFTKDVDSFVPQFWNNEPKWTNPLRFWSQASVIVW